jgi:hypothetical protein
MYRPIEIAIQHIRILRNTLAADRMMLQVLQDEADDEDARKLIQFHISSFQFYDELLNQTDNSLKELSRIEDAPALSATQPYPAA